MCEERDKLLDLLLEATKSHDAALHAIRKCDGKELARLTTLADSARNTFNDCYAVLAAHERHHACAEEVPSPP